MSRILITGTNGQVGFELKRALAPLGEAITLSREQMDLADSTNIFAVLNRYQPAIIVNSAAYTPINKAETEVKLAMAVNAYAPGIMAEWAEQHDTLPIHYSTDYLFDGIKDGTYCEDDAANPQSVYGHSKWEGEQVTRRCTTHHLILHTSWVVGAHGGNFEDNTEASARTGQP